MVSVVKKGAAGSITKCQHYRLVGEEYRLMDCSFILEQVSFWEADTVIHHDQEKEATLVVLKCGVVRKLAIDFASFDNLILRL